MRRMTGTVVSLALLAAALPGSAATPALSPAPTVAAVPEGLRAEANNSRRYRDWDRGRYRRHRDRGIGAGEVIAGVAVLGAIAALAGAFDGDGDRDRDRPRRVPIDARRDEDTQNRGLSRAVDICVAEVEGRGERVVRIDGATRDAAGWLVEGAVESAGQGEEGFSCRIGNDGRIEAVDRGRGAVRYQAALPGGAGAQYPDAVYARIRAGQSAGYAAPDDQGYDADPYVPAPSSGDGADADERYDDEPRPAYPGGPLPGEEGYETYAAPSDAVTYRTR
jgi:hypothetical protein